MAKKTSDAIDAFEKEVAILTDECLSYEKQIAALKAENEVSKKQRDRLHEKLEVAEAELSAANYTIADYVQEDQLKYKQLQKAQAEIGRLDLMIERVHTLMDKFVLKNMSIPMRAAECNDAMDILGKYMRDKVNSEQRAYENGKLDSSQKVLTIEHRQTGHWTTTPPTEPGWYQAVRRENIDFKDSEEFACVLPNGRVSVVSEEAYLELSAFILWGDKKETFPPLPESNDNG